MLDNALISNIISLLNSGLNSIGQAGILVKQAYQPTQQGANTAPTLYLHKIADQRIGTVYRANVWDATSSTMVYTETQQYVTTFQISGLATQDPTQTSGLTASDIVNYAVYVMQSLATITALEALGVGVLRVGDVRNPYFTDDRDRFEASPSFDFQLTHKQIITGTQPIITETELDIYRI